MQSTLITSNQIQTCRRKQKHKTKKEAVGHMFSLSLSENYDHKPLNVYQCEVCRKFHVGHLNMNYVSC